MTSITRSPIHRKLRPRIAAFMRRHAPLHPLESPTWHTMADAGARDWIR